MKPKFVLLDDEGNEIRVFDYAATGTVEVKAEVIEHEIDWDNFEAAPY
jgi:hypothetical protein